METIRKRVKKVGGENSPGEAGADSKVGECQAEEMEMVDLLEGPDLGFFEDHDQDKQTRESQFGWEEMSSEVRERRNKMGEIDKSCLADGFIDQLRFTSRTNSSLPRKMTLNVPWQRGTSRPT